jgi:hypothetical protein
MHSSTTPFPDEVNENLKKHGKYIALAHLTVIDETEYGRFREATNNPVNPPAQSTLEQVWGKVGQVAYLSVVDEHDREMFQIDVKHVMPGELREKKNHSSYPGPDPIRIIRTDNNQAPSVSYCDKPNYFTTVVKLPQAA